jgi:hypothetical protein
MSLRPRPQLLALGLVLLFLVSLVSPFADSNAEPFTENESMDSTAIGQSQQLTIGSWPDGANQRVEIAVPDGHSIRSLDLEVEAGTLSNSLATTMTDVGDFDVNAVYDGVNVNSSTLSILPSGAFWDFDSPGHGWSLGGGGNVWKVGYDSVLGQSGGVYSGTNALYTYDGNYPNNMNQFWATSPTIDCSGCSGAWELKYQRKLSIESRTWDRADVQVKNTQGNWVNIWSNSYNNDASFTLVSHTISTYLAGNPSFAVRFGLGTTDSSVTYTGWNIDDVSIEPNGGASGDGEGNWTSAPFGPSLLGRGENMMHGFLHFDASIPSGSIFEWQILDAATNAPVPGFERSSSTWMDLGMIDWHLYPLLKLKIYMKESSGGGPPEIHSISMNGHIHRSFDSDPSADGWQFQGGSWSNGAITGSGTVLSDQYRARGGFSIIDVNNTQSGNGQLQFSIDEGQSWTDIGDQDRVSLSKPAYMAQFRMTSGASGGSYTWDSFEAELVRTSVPDGLRLDVGLDGANEWSLDRPGEGIFGLQNTLITDDLWVVKSVAPSNTASLELALPTKGVEAFSFAVASPSGNLASPFMAMAVNGQDILSRTLSNINDLAEVSLTSTELTSLNDALLQANGQFGPTGLPMATVEIRIGSSLSSGDLLFGGVFAPYDANFNLELNAGHPLVLGLNHALASSIPVLGERTVKLPVRLDGTGSVYFTVMDIDSQASVKALELEVTNVSDTLVPGIDWIDSAASFDFSPLGITDALTHATQSGWLVELHLSGSQQQSKLQCPIASLPITSASIAACTASGTALLWFDDGQSGSISAVGSGQFLEIMHHFRFPDGWDDEPSATLSVSLISSEGPLLPVSKVFGLGHDLGVENDLEVKSWSILSNEGIRSSAEYPYMRAGEVVYLEVELGFENTSEGVPRSGQALVRFLVDGTEYATTTIFDNGVALFPYTVPAGRNSINLGIEVVPLRGQGVVTSMPQSLDFLFDNVPPTLMSSSVERFDSRDISPRTSLSFTVADRPHLPTHAQIYHWRSWVNDANENGVFDANEVVVDELDLPENLTLLMGDYHATLDTSQASEGDYFVGWIEIADSAGHVMEGGGSFAEPMFHVQLNANGAPSLGASSLGWSDDRVSPWLHPHETYEIRIPVWEPNGIFDISEIELNLATNTAHPAPIQWNQSTGSCTSSDVYVEVESCDLVPADASDLFSRNGEFVVNFLIEWGYDPDTSVSRIPQISLVDQSGQSNSFILEPLNWRFSGELSIDPESIEIVMEGEDVDSLGYWVQPRTTFDVVGDMVWYRTGTSPVQPLNVELMLGENNLEASVVNGTFSGSMIAPLVDGTYGLYGDLLDAPNGAVYRGYDSAFVWFIVDNEAPRVAAVDRPGFNSMLVEEEWEDLQFELRLDENAQLDEGTLRLHWSLNEAGLGLNSYVFDNGSVSLEILGERKNGDSIPVRCSLDLDSLMIPAFRTKAVELRIWVTGDDEAGLSIDAVFNDIDAPLRVWNLEQRVPLYAISDIEMKPSSDIHQGDLIEVSALITNSGLADGEANLVLEQVESSGARTRLDARAVDIQSGEQLVYQYNWKPGRDGSQWLELSIVNGPNAQSNTVLVDEPRSDGVFGTISTVNPALLTVVVLLTAGLIALLVFGLRREMPPPTRPVHAPIKDITSIPAPAPASGPYGEDEHARSPGENPYQ